MSDCLKKLVLKSVKKSYELPGRGVAVLGNVTCAFQEGQTYAIHGVSGSGKSTILHLLGGLDSPTAGDVLLEDVSIRLLGRDFLQNTIGFVFQTHYLVNELPVIENIMLPGLVKNISQYECQIRAEELLEMIGMSEKSFAYPAELSGGQQQRVAVARALFNKPAFLLADEPTGNLDAENAQRIVDVMLAANKAWGMGVIICSHDAAVYKRMQHVYLLDHGVLSLA